RTGGITRRMHHDVCRWELSERSSRAAETDVPGRVHRERRMRIIGTRIVDKTLLQQGAVAYADIVPENARSRRFRTLRPIASQHATAICENTDRPAPFVRAERIARRGLLRYVASGGAVRTPIRSA